MQIGIIDYGDEYSGSGNIKSIQNSLLYLGIKSKIIFYPEDILDTDKIILPGVGATGHLMKNLKTKNLDIALSEAVLTKGKPFLGICAGMQVLVSQLTEFGDHEGLGWISGKVVNIKERLPSGFVVPHTGWNDIVLKEKNILLDSYLNKYKSFYFSHSFSVFPDEKKYINSYFEYGDKKFIAGLSFDNVVAFQFHPEKSQISGQLLLKWFLNWKP